MGTTQRETTQPELRRAAAHAATASRGEDTVGELAGYVPVDMAGATPGVRPCTMAAALDVVGERWSLLALREIGYGVHTFARIVAFTGASRDILADRLRKLEAAGVVERRLYSEHPPRYEYHLTQAGHELFPITISLLTWGERWAVDAPAVVFRHSCGHRVAIELSCGHCGEPVTRASLTPVKRRTHEPARPTADGDGPDAEA
jgi:DNA-binding HxlR family transcriptional regulator